MAASLVLVGAAAGRAHTYNDVVGDAGAPDIASVLIAGDPASGALTVSVTAIGILGIDRGWEPDVSVWIDTDRDPSTGSASGCEYGLKFWRSPSGETAHVLRWDAANAAWEIAPQMSATPFTRASNTLTWRLATGDIGSATGFDFWIASAIYEDKRVIAEDVAPATGRWHYDVSAVPALFRDQIYDAAAPDISGVVVSTNARSGLTTMTITASSLDVISRTLKPEVEAYLNTDDKLSTGWVGFDYRLHFDRRTRANTWRIDRWNRSANGWSPASHMGSVRFGRHGDTVSWGFRRATIGNARRFTFMVASAIYVSGGMIADSAPGFGFWTYVIPTRK